MRLIQWISHLISSLVLRRSHGTDKTAFRPRLRRLKMFYVVLCAGCLPALSIGTALAQSQEASGTIVAAGFGYQIGDTSTIAVKVYDAASGRVLSDESFDLNVKEDGPARPDSARIFAGGVGPGATDLSNFVLRVYDAKTGAFQWEGQLNLTPKEDPGSGHLVSTVVQRRATVTKVLAPAKAARQPLFHLRAVDSSTGGLVWEDEFSTDGRKLGRFERIANRPLHRTAGEEPASRTIDFSIRMVEADGRTVAWEDQFARQEAQDESSSSVPEERAQLLQAWPGFLEEVPDPVEL